MSWNAVAKQAFPESGRVSQTMQASRRRETRRSCLSFRDAPTGQTVGFVPISGIVFPKVFFEHLSGSGVVFVRPSPAVSTTAHAADSQRSIS
jgi:hypothetical protein